MGRGRASLVAVIVSVLVVGTPAMRAFADINNSTGTNVQSGDNRATTNEGGKSASGDAVGGQVTGVVTGGRTSVDATNVSKDSSVTSGDAHASNSSSSYVGQATARDDITVAPADLSFIAISGAGGNAQDGSNRQSLTQTANATTGDGVAGEVIGVVTAAGGSTSVVAANSTTNSDVTTGDARSNNSSRAFVGQAMSTDDGIAVSDISNVTADQEINLQDGKNLQAVDENATSTTGDGVAGQVIGAVSAGATSIDARNSSDNVSVQTGDARSDNNSISFVGQAFADFDPIALGPADITNVNTSDEVNLQDGNNRQSLTQAATSSSGDGVAGEVIGAVTSAGGSASIVAANSSTNSDVTTGDGRSANDSSSLVGQGFAEDDTLSVTTDITNVTATYVNAQDGNNTQTLAQSATSATGDGVAGQVVGAVSAGATSIDANNHSDNVDVTTGDARTVNNSSALVGQAQADSELQIGPVPADISNIDASEQSNIQDGNNRQSMRQAASATTGDGVAGEVIGAVTSAGGSTSIVGANTSSNSDVTTGDSNSSNNSATFVGLALNQAFDVSVIADINAITSESDANIQDGNNTQTLSQSSTSTTGDGVAGQVIGAVSAGRTSVDASNTSDNMTVTTGDAHSSNTSNAFVGLAFSEDEDVQIGFSTDITNVTVDDNANIQDGDNRGTLSQSSTAATGDGVGGEVIGAVTSAGGSASIVAANRSTNSDVTTGDANASNDASSFVGLANADDEVEVALGDLSNIDVTADGNLQNGSNHLTLDQTASSSTGDGIAGQVLGVVSAGAASVDARNTSDDVSATSGDATTANDAAEFVGEAIGRTESIEVGPGASDIANATGTNIQDGSNRKTQTQSASATSGDAVAGQVLAGVTAGVITGAGGSASVVVANTSSNLDSTSGDATFDNGASDFIGQAFTTGPVTIAPLT